MTDTNSAATDEAQGPQFSVQRIYLKDASVETPNTPHIFTKEWNPEVNMDLNTRVKEVGDNNYEVVLSLTITTSVEEEVAFLVEVQQAGIFALNGFARQDLNQMLGAFCPNLLFPYAREAVDNLVTKASFPAMMLAPVNFDALYNQQMQQKQAQAEESQEDIPPPQTH